MVIAVRSFGCIKTKPFAEEIDENRKDDVKNDQNSQRTKKLTQEKPEEISYVRSTMARTSKPKVWLMFRIIFIVYWYRMLVIPIKRT